jgi:hypothetical protein
MPALLLDARLTDGTDANLLVTPGQNLSNVVASTLVYNPTATVSAGNQYRTFAELAAASKAIVGVKFIAFGPGSFAIPAGTYDFGVDAIFVGSNDNPGAGLPNTTLTFAAGSTLRGLYEVWNVVLVATGTLISQPGTDDYTLTFRGFGGVSPAAASPNPTLLANGGSGQFTVFFKDETGAGSPAGNAIGSTGAGSVMFAEFDDGSIFARNTFSQGAGAFTVVQWNSSSEPIGQSFNAQSGMPGGTLVIGSTLFLIPQISIDQGQPGNAVADASTTIQYAAGVGAWQQMAARTAARTITFGVGDGPNKNARMRFTVEDSAAFAVTVVNGGAGAGTLGVIPSGAKGFVEAQYDGTNWIFSAGGSL